MWTEHKLRTAVAALSAVILLAAALPPVRAQQAAAPAPPQPAADRGGQGGLNDPCGGRSNNPREACPNDVVNSVRGPERGRQQRRGT